VKTSDSIVKDQSTHMKIICSLNLLCLQRCNEDISKIAGTAMRFTVKNQYLIN